MTNEIYPAMTRKKLSNYQNTVKSMSRGVQNDVDLDLLNKVGKKVKQDKLVK